MLTLWRRRQREGWTQKRVAEAIGRDPGWVSRNLRAPGNWTLQTAGEFVQGLDGEAEVTVAALEDPIQFASNRDAYDAYDGYRAPRRAVGVTGFVGTVSVRNPMVGNFAIKQGESYEMALGSVPIPSDTKIAP